MSVPVVVRRGRDEYEARLLAAGTEARPVDLADQWFGATPVEVLVDGRRVRPETPLAECGVREGSEITFVDPTIEAREEEAPPASPGAAGESMFRRPPRARSRPELPEIRIPAPPPEIGAPARFGWAALVIPVVLGIVMAVLFHPRMALFAVFSPAMMLANWVEDRRRIRRERRHRAGTRAQDLVELEKRVASAHRLATQCARRETPTLGQLVGRAVGKASSLWERRPAHDDFLRLGIGTGCVPWQAHVVAGGTLPGDVGEILTRYDTLHDVPLAVDLTSGAILGISGPRSDVLPLARALVVQAAVLHGPADLQVTIISDIATDWDWAKWLPHVLIDATGRRRLACDPQEGPPVLAALPQGSPSGVREGQRSPMPQHHLVILDGEPLAAPEGALLRAALHDGEGRRLGAIALAGATDRLPSLCSAIVEATPDGLGRLFRPDGAGPVVDAELWRAPAVSARRVARALARLDDAELDRGAVHLPDAVRLVDLLGIEAADSATIVWRWGHLGTRPFPPFVLGMTEEGPLEVDLVSDGPHGLLAGTTGSGKSELLRTLVVSLAATVDPDRLNFVLVDYKGGSAFDACARLPHTVGVVTDLDGHLARRALTCLEAELRYREELLRRSGVSDISQHVRGNDAPPLPRLLVVIDEFAALAKELPDFLTALVDVAQRGRSLGVHLLLATQRPGGVVGDGIRANTNLRISLRVQDHADSVDVVGSPAAAGIGRHQPGRGLLRRGPGEIIAFQAAHVSGRGAVDREAVTAAPFVFAHEQPPPGVATTGGDEGPDDLEVLVDAINAASNALDLGEPRSPWPDPLPTEILRADLDTSHPGDSSRPLEIAFGLADEPHRQRLVPARWGPEDGNLLLFGLRGSGTSTALATLAVGLAERASPDEVHVYVIDFDDQLLGPLADLPHVGAVIAATDRERQVRLLRRLHHEVQERRRALAANPAALARSATEVVFIDGFAGLAAAFDDPGDLGIKAMLTRVIADGPGVGIVVVATAKQPTDIPGQIASLTAAKLVFRLADRYDYTCLGLTVDEPTTVAGRCFESATAREVQVALPHGNGVAAAVAAVAAMTRCRVTPSRPPAMIGVLPGEVKTPDIVGAARLIDDEWFIPLGIGDGELTPAGIVLRDGDHALIAGPSRSGKSTALVTIAEVVAAARPDIEIHAVTPRRSPLHDCTEVVLCDAGAGDLDVAMEDRTSSGAERLVLIDDAELVEGCDALSELLAGRRPGVHVVAAGNAEALRAAYGHWTQAVRRSRVGLALRPNPGADGDLWQTQLPRRDTSMFVPGRGYLVADGRVELVQVAWR